MLLSPSHQPAVLDGSFHCTVRPDRDAAIVVPEGELDIATAPLLEAELTALRDAGFERLVVDLRGLTFIDATGVHLFLRWAASATRRGHAFSLVPGAQRIQMVLAMTGVVEMLMFDRP